jgi:hypothetical protein
LHSIKLKEVFQTLEDRSTERSKVEQNGPYSCRWENSWLGNGYYFWDTFVENAHWWGKEVRKFNNGYIICKAQCDFNTSDCLDLHGDLEQLKLFKEAFELMLANGVVHKKTTVRNFLQKLKGQSHIFNQFKAIRVNGIQSKNYGSDYAINFLFEKNKWQYFEMIPAVQICFFEKQAMNLRDYKIIFPEYYMEGYYV